MSGGGGKSTFGESCDAPSAAGVELGLGRVQGVAATLADEVTLSRVELVVLAGSSGLSSLLAENLERELVELLLPLSLALLHAGHHHDSRTAAEGARADRVRSADPLGRESAAGGELSTRDSDTGDGDRGHRVVRLVVTDTWKPLAFRENLSSEKAKIFQDWIFDFFQRGMLMLDRSSAAHPQHRAIALRTS